MIWLWLACDQACVRCVQCTQAPMRPVRASHSASSTALCPCDCLLPCAHRRMRAMLHRPTAIGTATIQQKQHQISAPSCQASAPGAHAVQGRKPAPTFVEVFRGAAQYVKSHRNQTMVICLPSEVNFLGIAVLTQPMDPSRGFPARSAERAESCVSGRLPALVPRQPGRLQQKTRSH